MGSQVPGVRPPRGCRGPTRRHQCGGNQVAPMLAHNSPDFVVTSVDHDVQVLRVLGPAGQAPTDQARQAQEVRAGPNLS